MNKRLRAIAASLILLTTIATFIYYFVHHPETWRQLGNVAPTNLIIIFGLYICFTGSLALILLATVGLCNVRLRRIDGLLLTMWSSIINFFGPLQSGPAFRAVYLKKGHAISLKNYSLATLLYYGFYALYSGLFLLSGIIPWPILALLTVVGIVLVVILLRSQLKLAKQLRALPLRQAYKLGLATLLQVVLIALIYTVELKSINPSITVHQAVIYSGAANFALFVSITPGAIGFREAFLVFSEKLHHITPSTILTANVIDRAAYVALLGLLFLVAISLHVKKRLTVTTESDTK